MRSVIEILRHVISFIVDLADRGPTADEYYWQFLKKFSVVAVILVLALASLPVLGSVLNVGWLTNAYLFLVATLAALWLLAALPIFIVSQLDFENYPSARWSVQIAGGLLCFFLLLLIYLSLMPASESPAVLALLILLSPALTFGFVKLGIGADPRQAPFKLLCAFSILVLGFFMLGSQQASVTLATWFATEEAEPPEPPKPPLPPRNPGGGGTDPKPDPQPPRKPTPRPIRYDWASPEAIRAIQFVDATTGKPRVWYARTFEGKYDLFDNEGFHPVEFAELKPVTQTVVQDILTLAAEEQQRRKEAEEKEKEKKNEPEKSPPGPGPGPTPVVPVEPIPTPPPPQPTTPLTKIEGPPRVLVLAGDESDSAWTTNITAEQLERAFVLSSNVQPILRSEIPADVIAQLSQTPLHDPARLSEAAKKVGARYIVIGTCLEATDQQDNFIASMPSGRLQTTVRIQMLDAQTGASIYSRGFEGREYTKVLGGAPIGGPEGGAAGAYRKKMKEFASQFVTAIDRSDLNTR
jgi:hypothetical protein